MSYELCVHNATKKNRTNGMSQFDKCAVLSCFLNVNDTQYRIMRSAIRNLSGTFILLMLVTLIAVYREQLSLTVYYQDLVTQSSSDLQIGSVGEVSPGAVFSVNHTKESDLHS